MQFNSLGCSFDVCRGPGNLAVVEILQPHHNLPLIQSDWLPDSYCTVCVCSCMDKDSAV